MADVPAKMSVRERQLLVQWIRAEIRLNEDNPDMMFADGLCIAKEAVKRLPFAVSVYDLREAATIAERMEVLRD